MNTGKSKDPILEVDGLQVRFNTRDGVVHAVNNITFNLFRGESLGIVGESGCGKSVTALSLLQLIPPPGVVEANRIMFNGTDLLNASEKKMMKIRGNKISMVFQDPMTSLNPVLTIGKQMGEVIKLHLKLSDKEIKEECIKLLDMVGISAAETRLRSYPHQLSGGMRQRVMIAMGISCHPSILLADEPTTALDVTIQDQIIRLLKSLAQQLHMATILITHNFGTVAGNTDRVIVMYAGYIVESAPTMELFHHPKHPYTIALLQSIPRVNHGEQSRLFSIQGNLPSPLNLPEGCSFAPRCDSVQDICWKENPRLEQRGENHHAACWRVQ